MGAVDAIHPDLATSGSILETKKVGDYPMEHGVPMAMHFAGTPISFMAGLAVVPDRPGLGVEPNPEVVKAHLKEPGYFEPTPEWDKERSWDRLWS